MGRHGRDPLSGLTAGLMMLFMIACGIFALAAVVYEASK